MNHRLAAAALLLFLVVPVRIRGQAISPGKLSQAHAELEGVRNCTRCHELRKPGVSPERCLDCHAPLRTRIQQGKGLHGRLANKSCGECHKEHFGRELELARFDESTFAHGDVGYALEGAHARARCAACHRAERVTAADVRGAAPASLDLERTFLGLPTSCAGCHADEDPHAGQFRGRDCDVCHTPDEWDPADHFDHDVARYRLTGSHQAVACAGCHPTITRAGASVMQYTGLTFASCHSCHQDPHRGAMGTDCAACHATSGWARVAAAAVASRFDHGSTRFALRGAHARATCGSCHQRNASSNIRLRFVTGTETHTYPRPMAAACGSCHLDPHDVAPGSTSCAGCHTEGNWSPASYDAGRHATTSFPLTGAHATVPCTSCHARATSGAPRFRIGDASCRACHAAVDPHRSAFGEDACDRCHVTTSFEVRDWDHARTPEVACSACHAADDPHGPQFGGRICGECHGTESFKITAIDHARTRFPLTGKHAELACRRCHVPMRTESDSILRTRYRPLPVRCEECHGGEA